MARIEKVRLPKTSQGRLQRRNTKLLVHTNRNLPAKHIPADQSITATR
jgi:hypothetical protein